MTETMDPNCVIPASELNTLVENACTDTPSIEDKKIEEGMMLLSQLEVMNASGEMQSCNLPLNDFNNCNTYTEAHQLQQNPSQGIVGDIYYYFKVLVFQSMFFFIFVVIMSIFRVNSLEFFSKGRLSKVH